MKKLAKGQTVKRTLKAAGIKADVRTDYQSKIVVVDVDASSNRMIARRLLGKSFFNFVVR